MAQIKQLRIVATLLFAFAVAQAGLGSGHLDSVVGVVDTGRVHPLLIAHATNAFAVLVLAVISAVLGVNLRRAGRPAWVLFLPLGIIIAIAVQMMLGFAKVTGAHVFLGVLILCAVTAYCSYSWRLRVPEAAPVAEATGPSTAV